MKFENIAVYNFEGALRGMRNPKNSHHLSDSKYTFCKEDEYTSKEISYKWTLNKHKDLAIGSAAFELKALEYQKWLNKNGILNKKNGICDCAFIGPDDMRLMKVLIKGGSEHRKFLRQIQVSVDITAPLYWWKEFDTYKIGTTANSTSTMHKIQSIPITLESFEIDDYNEFSEEHKIFVKNLIDYCEGLRKSYNNLIELSKKEELSDQIREDARHRAKIIWKELIRWLPEGWLQTRTITFNYENLISMFKQRCMFHKLNEWCGKECDTPTFRKFILSLPYMEDILLLYEND